MNERLVFLREKTAALTTSPGCYIMKDASGNIIYIGKAKSLKNRVTSYFREAADHTPKVAKMVSQVYDYDFIVTDSEFEALILECSLIKLHKPKYNILLKDDKGYAYIKISDEPFPRITSVLQKSENGELLGPYMSSYTTKQNVNEANKAFSLPTCTRKFPQDFGKQRPCLNYFIKQCMGVCTGNIPENEYREIVSQAVDYIKGGSTASVEMLTSTMEKEAEELNFEAAARIRDRISAIKKVSDRQKVIETSYMNTDVIGMSHNGEYSVASILMYRSGRLYKADFFLGELGEAGASYEDFLTQYYSTKSDIPREILVDEELEERELIEQFLRERARHAVTLICPKRGEGLKLSMLAKNNASEFLSIKVGRTGREIIALEELSKLLGLSKPPQYIECYDISNLASTAMVAGMIVFENGRPLKKAYKRFSIKTVEIQNDYACMQEVIRRRFTRYYESGDEGFSRLPDLILLDGGKGHVSSVKSVLAEMKINVPVFGIVKDSKHKTRAVASSGAEISVSSVKSAFMLLTKIQDEVHRFAISYQRTVHSKNTYSLELTKIKGIGLKKAQKLIIAFKTKEALNKATPEELSKTAGISLELAKELHSHIHGIL
ncbi:MAG: excinuclease ABC subunit UvrC [Oscillospiraceae bacterium]